MKNVKGGNCASNEFECSNGTCISQIKIMDGIMDCPDGSDETEEASVCVGWRTRAPYECYNCCVIVYSPQYCENVCF